MFILILIFIATILLAYANGANDNFKGLATLFGSKTLNYKTAISWATITTFLGSISSIFLAETLLKNFSGKGLVPDIIVASPNFILAVALGAGLTVLLATFTGIPISTTHSLIGALVGGGLMAVGTQVNFPKLGNTFFFPLLASPLISVIMSSLLYLFFRLLRIRLGVTKSTCVCIEKQELIPAHQAASTLSIETSPSFEVTICDEEKCEERYNSRLLGINSQTLLDVAHFFSGGIVCFARGLNDTPKIVALLLFVNAFSIKWGMLAVGIGMAAGGLLNAKKVAITMSEKITSMNHGQGFTANLITSFLVIFASRWGLPVSTTHVSAGSLFGIGFITRQGNPSVISGIVLSWILTLPIAALISGGVYWILNTIT